MMKPYNINENIELACFDNYKLYFKYHNIVIYDRLLN